MLHTEVAELANYVVAHFGDKKGSSDAQGCRGSAQALIAYSGGFVVPLIRIDVLKGRTPDEIKKLSDAIHEAILTAFKVPVRDRYQIVYEHGEHTLIIEDSGLGIKRSEKLVVVSVVSRPRRDEAKLAFYRVLCENLENQCGIAPTDVMVNITTNTDADWSFGRGRAQFLTGEL